MKGQNEASLSTWVLQNFYIYDIDLLYLNLRTNMDPDQYVRYRGIFPSFIKIGESEI